MIPQLITSSRIGEQLEQVHEGSAKEAAKVLTFNN
jgi:hypothetical protein